MLCYDIKTTKSWNKELVQHDIFRWQNETTVEITPAWNFLQNDYSNEELWHVGAKSKIRNSLEVRLNCARKNNPEKTKMFVNVPVKLWYFC